ncbi:hypothetical protein BD410DRAFT_720480 [Rickenella mellea]|uniref:Aip3p/Bud6 N-terminal domain-containing protein n=1 Tax=Rickenella mellea TaxID=50990 RepID=A0A4Y7Q925_9AGAM|nr:hypothetical protein BD410DRAFT_720480 [Rickenella mellea]
MDVPAAIAALLDSTRRLQSSLRQWSLLQISETEVSDVYVKVCTDFHIAVAALSSYNIDMSDVMSFPQAMRDILEGCLAEDASPQVLEAFQPRVRQTIAHLLHGLQSKQNAYQRAVRGQR